jgi:hypothetical protein
VPPIVLTTLKILFLALLYVFIARAVRNHNPAGLGRRERDAGEERRV